eukprot:GHVQ01027722.1.p1 GENE.GHVQ01027722.1~~GHVQ01027722.1.p1  ORF type:complete len:805 (-),score=75.98 GHVQ01027722.1:99-2513(-)
MSSREVERLRNRISEATMSLPGRETSPEGKTAADEAADDAEVSDVTRKNGTSKDKALRAIYVQSLDQAKQQLVHQASVIQDQRQQIDALRASKNSHALTNMKTEISRYMDKSQTVINALSQLLSEEYRHKSKKPESDEVAGVAQCFRKMERLSVKLENVERTVMDEIHRLHGVPGSITKKSKLTSRCSRTHPSSTSEEEVDRDYRTVRRCRSVGTLRLYVQGAKPSSSPSRQRIAADSDTESMSKGKNYAIVHGPATEYGGMYSKGSTSSSTECLRNRSKSLTSIDTNEPSDKATCWAYAGYEHTEQGLGSSPMHRRNSGRSHVNTDKRQQHAAHDTTSEMQKPMRDEVAAITTEHWSQDDDIDRSYNASCSSGLPTQSHVDQPISESTTAGATNSWPVVNTLEYHTVSLSLQLMSGQGNKSPSQTERLKATYPPCVGFTGAKAAAALNSRKTPSSDAASIPPYASVIFHGAPYTVLSADASAVNNKPLTIPMQRLNSADPCTVRSYAESVSTDTEKVSSSRDTFNGNGLQQEADTVALTFHNEVQEECTRPGSSSRSSDIFGPPGRSISKRATHRFRPDTAPCLRKSVGTIKGCHTEQNVSTGYITSGRSSDLGSGLSNTRNQCSVSYQQTRPTYHQPTTRSWHPRSSDDSCRTTAAGSCHVRSTEPYDSKPASWLAAASCHGRLVPTQLHSNGDEGQVPETRNCTTSYNEILCKGSRRNATESAMQRVANRRSRRITEAIRQSNFKHAPMHSNRQAVSCSVRAASKAKSTENNESFDELKCWPQVNLQSLVTLNRQLESQVR